MASLAVDLAQTRLVASILLVAYVAAVAVLSPREIGFLKSVAKPYRVKFIILDILLQFSILLVLIPTIISPLDNLNSWWVVGVGFLLLWVTVVWTAISRYLYTYRFLIRQHDRVKKEITKLQQQAKTESDHSE